MVNINLFKKYGVIYANSHRFEDIYVWNGSTMRNLGQGHGVQYQQWIHSMANISVYYSHNWTFSLALTVFQILTFQIWWPWKILVKVAMCNIRMTPFKVAMCNIRMTSFNCKSWSKSRCATFEWRHSKSQCATFEWRHSKSRCATFEWRHSKSRCVTFEWRHSIANTWLPICWQ